MGRILTWRHDRGDRTRGIDDSNVDIGVDIYKYADIDVGLCHFQEGFHVTGP